MPKRLLVLVPHQDDELNIAGQVLPTFIESGYECKICFSTNGDGFSSNGPVRLKEAVRVADYFGIDRTNLVFLGFEDCMGPDHPYNRISEEDKVSAPLTKTYSDSTSSYSELRCGMPQPQCRETMVADVESLLFDYRPDVIVCIDFDSHPDHRALSLAFEAAMGNILRSYDCYKPLVLKKFAYSSVWYGPFDYSTFAPTQRPAPGALFELDNPMYTWEERICVAPHPSTLTKFFFNNRMFKAACRYSSQNAWWFMYSVCNADVVYWCRRTDNQVLKAMVSASSGDASCLKDFLLFDTSDVLAQGGTSQYEGYGLRFEDYDDTCKVTVSFDKPIRVAELIVRLAPGAEGNVRFGAVFDDDVKSTVLLRASDNGRFSIRFDKEATCMCLTVTMLRKEGVPAPCITSIEAYPTSIDNYTPLNSFLQLTGSPRVMKGSSVHYERLLRLFGRITRRVANLRLRYREKRWKQNVEGNNE